MIKLILHLIKEKKKNIIHFLFLFRKKLTIQI